MTLPPWHDLRSSQVLGSKNPVMPHTAGKLGYLDSVAFVGGTVLV